MKIWDISTGRCVTVLSGHTMSVTCLRWGGEGLIYTGSQDRTVKVYAEADVRLRGRACPRRLAHLVQGKLVRTLEGHAHWVNTMALNTDFALRTGAIDHTGKVIEDKAAAREYAKKRYEHVKGGRPERLVTRLGHFTMFLWTPGAGKKPVNRMTGHQQLINQVCFSPDGATSPPPPSTSLSSSGTVSQDSARLGIVVHRRANRTDSSPRCEVTSQQSIKCAGRLTAGCQPVELQSIPRLPLLPLTLCRTALSNYGACAQRKWNKNYPGHADEVSNTPHCSC